MIVYLLINTVTEMSIVGSTIRPLSERIAAYFDDAKKDKPGSMFDALREWPRWAWEAVVLEVVEPSSGVRGMVLSEARWICELGTADPRVGYNSTIPDERHAARLEKQLSKELIERRAAERDVTECVPPIIVAKTKLPNDDAWMSRYLARHGDPEQRAREARRRMKKKSRSRAREKEKRLAASAAFNSMTEEQRTAFFRECGLRGGATKHVVRASVDEMRRRAQLGGRPRASSKK